MSSSLEELIQHLRKSIPKLESRIRQMKTQTISDDRVKDSWNIVLNIFEEILIRDIKNLKQYEEWRNEEIKQKFKKKVMNNLIGVSGNIKAGKDLVGQMIQYIGDEVAEPTFERFNDYIDNIYDNQKYEIKKCADKLKDCLCLILGCTRKELEDRDFKDKKLSDDWEVWKFELDYDANLFDGNCQLVEIIFPTKRDAKNYIKDYKLINVVKVYSEHLTPRKILQLLGTEGGRMVIHPNIWVNALFADYYNGEILTSVSGFSQKTTPSHWIITDVRFPKNEGKAISNRNGLLIGIKRLFSLRFPEYNEITDLNDLDDGYEIPKKLEKIDPKLYETLTHESETSMGDHSWCDVIIENNGTVEELFYKVCDAVLPKK